MPALGVIGGSGLYEIPGLEIIDSVKMSTPYGEPSDVYRIGTMSGKEIAFLPRHGSLHNVQPHRINYKANIWGFRELGVERILSIGAAGGISGRVKPGLITIPDQIIDMTNGRSSTFYDEDEVVHVDFTEPYCRDLREYVLRSSEESGVEVFGAGVYVCTNGPRLETAAEIKTFSFWGADVVGMTAMPEASLARELEICLAGISVVTNYAAGISGRKLSAHEVVETMKSSTERLKKLLSTFFALDFGAPGCSCRGTVQDARM